MSRFYQVTGWKWKKVGLHSEIERQQHFCTARYCKTFPEMLLKFCCGWRKGYIPHPSTDGNILSEEPRFPTERRCWQKSRMADVPASWAPGQQDIICDPKTSIGALGAILGVCLAARGLNRDINLLISRTWFYSHLFWYHYRHIKSHLIFLVLQKRGVK